MKIPLVVRSSLRISEHEIMQSAYTFLRYTAASLSTALIDYIVFYISFSFSSSVLSSIYIARAIAVTYNFLFVKKIVFHTCHRRLITCILLHLTLVCTSGFFAVQIIHAITSRIAINVVFAKSAAELLLYLPIYFIQKKFIFKESVS